MRRASPFSRAQAARQFQARAIGDSKAIADQLDNLGRMAARGGQKGRSSECARLAQRIRALGQRMAAQAGGA